MIRNALALLGTANYSIPGRINAFWHEHAEIIEAIERRDPEAAEKRRNIIFKRPRKFASN